MDAISKREICKNVFSSRSMKLIKEITPEQYMSRSKTNDIIKNILVVLFLGVIIILFAGAFGLVYFFSKALN